jgi:hypothetical protein
MMLRNEERGQLQGYRGRSERKKTNLLGKLLSEKFFGVGIPSGLGHCKWHNTPDDCHNVKLGGNVMNQIGDFYGFRGVSGLRRPWKVMRAFGMNGLNEHAEREERDRIGKNVGPFLTRRANCPGTFHRGGFGCHS